MSKVIKVLYPVTKCRECPFSSSKDKGQWVAPAMEGLNVEGWGCRHGGHKVSNPDVIDGKCKFKGF